MRLLAVVACGVALAAAISAPAATGSAAAATPPCAQPPPETPPPGFFAYHCQRLRGISVGYREAGHGRPLVMIPGYAMTAGIWDPELIAGLTARHRVIAPDNRGAGTTTDTPHNRLTIAEMADDVAALIRKLDLRRPDVLGWSMGGFIAQELVLRHPRLVRRLILAGTDPGGPHAVQAGPWATRILSNPNATPVQLLPVLFPKGKRGLGRAWYGRIAADYPYMPPQALKVSVRTQRQQDRANGPLWYRRGGGAYRGLPGVSQPTLVADGSKDVLERPPNSRIIARRIPRSWLHIYPDAGHAFLVQYNTAFARRVNRFLSRDLPRRRRSRDRHHGHARRHGQRHHRHGGDRPRLAG